MILEVTINIDDALALVMTNKTLYSLGFPYIQQCLIEFASPCVGSRIICLGDLVKIDDLPDTITSQERKEMQMWQITQAKPRNFYSYAHETFPRTDSALFAAWRYVTKRWVRYCEEDVRMTEGLWYDALKDILKLDEPDQGSLVLCNLTKQEYVDGAEATRIVKREGFSSDTQSLLGNILRCRICWSSTDSRSMAFNSSGIRRGVWAGDRFEVTTMDRFVALIGETQQVWKDATQDGANEVMGLWKGFFR